MKQTATDYLYECFIDLFRQYTEDEIDGGKFGELITEAHQQAKEMEKQQQKYFFECGRNFQLTGEGTFEQYYTSTFNHDTRRIH